MEASRDVAIYFPVTGIADQINAGAVPVLINHKHIQRFSLGSLKASGAKLSFGIVQIADFGLGWLANSPRISRISVGEKPRSRS